MSEEKLEQSQLLEISGSYWKTCVLHASIKLDIFTNLDNGPLSDKNIAEKLNVDQRALSMLLNALTAMHLITKSDSGYSNTSSSKELLSKNSPSYMGYIIRHHHNLINSWAQLNLAVKTGFPVISNTSDSEEEERESFCLGMFNMAMSIAPKLVQAISLSDRHQLLDLGGGPGTYAIHFCLSNPQLKATVFDLPPTRPFAEKIIEKFNLSDRVKFMAGDYLKDEIKGRYDVAWLSHILHAQGLKECQTIIQKAISVLKPGGLMIVHDFILNDTMDNPLFPALFSLNMLLRTESGQSYSEAQITKMLSHSGLQEIKRISFQGPNDSGIIMGVVPL